MTRRRSKIREFGECVIVDASVAVKWFVPEPGAEAAKNLFKRSTRMTAPSQVMVEVASAILRRMRDGTLSPYRTRQSLDEWMTMLSEGLVDITDNSDLFEQAVDLSYEIGHPLPDCLYLALSTRLGAMLLTCDQKFHARAESRCDALLMRVDD